jgi:phospholipase/lecithinase/hemolysin
MKKSLITKLMSTIALALLMTFTPLNSSVHAWQGEDENPFSAMYVFGDSLSDTGNFYALSGGFPPPPYFQGRISNGIVWAEYLAMSLGLGVADFHNYAVAGASSGRDNFNDDPLLGIEFPGLHDEIDQFVADLEGSRADRNALYVIWIGANDFFAADFDPTKDIPNAIRNTTRAVRRLRAQGAEHIVVVNLPDLGLTPFAQSVQPPGILTYLSAIYNANLDRALNQLARVGVDTIRVDSAAVLQDIVANPGNYPPLFNVTDAYLFTGMGDPNTYLFWDRVHPTTTGHAIIASAAFEVIMMHVL